MSDDLLIRVDAQVSEFNAAFGSATKSSLQLEAALKRASAQQELLQKQINTYGKDSAQAQAALTRAATSNARLMEEQQKRTAAQYHAMQSAGRGLLLTGGAVTLALGLSAKAALDWEHSWALARQAIAGTPKQLDAVEQGLRGLATTLPVTHDQILEIARSAGQLGVATPNIVKFTKVVAELGQTSDLSGDDAATSLARIINVMGISQGKVENLASAMTKLGQAGASTVGEIAALTLRMAAAGRTAGFSVGDVTGFANAMSSLGIQAEAGGTNFSKTILMINTAVQSGGKNLKGFADIAGKSAAQFKQEWGTDATAATVDFLKGLDGIRKSGGDVAGTLATLHITSLRQIDVLNRLSQNTDLVTQSLSDGNKAYQDNTALTQAFGKVQQTTAAQMQVAANNVHDLAIDLGTVLLPALGKVAGALDDMVKGFQSLPGPVKEAITVLTLMGTGMALLGGAVLITRAKLFQLQQTMAEMNAAGTGMSRGMMAARAGAGALAIGLGTLAAATHDSNRGLSDLTTVAAGAAAGFSVTGGPWGAAIGGAVGLLAALAGKSADAKREIDDLTSTLNKQTGAITKNTRAWAVKSLEDSGALESAQKLGLSLSDVTDAVLSGGPPLDALVARLVKMQKAGTSYVVAGHGTASVMNDQAQAATSLIKILTGQNSKVNEATSAWQRQNAAMGQATLTAHQLAAAIAGIHDKTVTVTTSFQRNVGPAQNHADGGLIRGPGTGTSDSIPINASNGEYMVRKAAVDVIGVQRLDAINRMGYASGGPVGRPSDWSKLGSHIGTQIQRQGMVNFNAPVYTHDPDNLARKIGRAQQRALDMALS